MKMGAKTDLKSEQHDTDHNRKLKDTWNKQGVIMSNKEVLSCCMFNEHTERHTDS